MYGLFKDTLSWRNLPSFGKARGGVIIEHTVVIGIDERFSATTNRRLIKMILGTLANGASTDEFIARYVHHLLETFGWLPQWLPAVWERYAKRH